MGDENPHQFFTAGEVAALAKEHGVACVPNTKSGMIKWIKRQEADYVNCFSRKREGQKGGGGTEYKWAFFPEVIWNVLDNEIERRNALAPYEPPKRPETIRERHRRYREISKQPPDLTAPRRTLAWSLAAAAGLNGSSLTFRPFLVRKVSRCFVEFDLEKYFSHDLDAYHSRLVCITGTDKAPHLLWVLEYNMSRYERAGPGKLVCIADRTANKVPYVSEDFQQSAEAKRAAGQRRRKLLR